MSFFATVTFDLEDAVTPNYDTANKILSELGFSKSVKGRTDKLLDLPANTYVGEFNGEGSGKIRDDLSNRIRDAFKDHDLKASIFVVVGDGWAWGIRAT
jgi:hypothetical protein